MKKMLVFFLLSALLLSGCQMRTVDQMYAPPKRSDDYNSLQSVINQSMEGLEYSAPTSGDNQQIVQMADLNGDEIMECVLFAKGGDNLPMHMMVFSLVNEEYVLSQTIDLPGSSFDRVEYAPIDDGAGMEIIVGTQVSDQVSRSVWVYSFSTGEAQQLVTEDYVKFLTVDLNGTGRNELFVIRSGSNDFDRGIVELFSHSDGVIQRSVELNMSETADNLKRILVGQLQGGKPAVYVASAVDEDTLITDVYAIVDGAFTNVSLSNESGTSVKTMRNYFVYADDMDSDDIMELPSLIAMRSIDKTWYGYDQNLISWYSMTAEGEEVHKLYTYHNFLGGWYLQIDDAIALQLSVVDLGSVCDFYVWDQGSPIKVMSVHTLTGQNREVQSTMGNRFVLHKTESVIYAASLDNDAERFHFTQQSVCGSFHMIHEHWNTGEA